MVSIHCLPDSLLLDLRVKIEERLQAGAQLLLDFFFAAFEYVHRDVSLTPADKFYRSLPYLGHVFRRQQPHSVNQCQIRHA